jgi:CRISPR/Cas system-associated exonuclease Cas4 (RecB family)
MGILETRCLDFEQVIITSFNEGIYPQKDNTNTYIPYNIRMHFGLPTTEHQDAIYAYNFYRLIQRAKQVYLLYDTRSDGKGNAGEISRFAQQLTYLYKHRIQPVQVNCSTQICAISPVSIKQDKEIIQEKVKHYLTQSGLAPTALNTFINCPLQFYFEKIEKLTINKPLSIELEANQIGNVFHYVMEHLYKEFENQEISKEILEEKIINRQEKLDLLLKRAMIKEIHQLNKEEEIDSLMEVYTIKGIMQLTMEVIKEYVLACVKQDKAITPFVYVGGEKNYHRVLDNENPAYIIKIKGTIDRIDSRNDGIHIIDYKTSNVKEDKSNNQALINIADLFDPDSKVEKKNELLQVCFYKLLTAQEFTGNNVSCHLYHVKRMFTAPDEFQALSIKILPDNWEETFMEHLNQKIQDMYNVDILTKPTDRIKSCKYCDFKDLCGR